MDRREFCRRLALVSGSIAMSPLIKACNQVADSVGTAIPTTAAPAQKRPTDIFDPTEIPSPTATSEPLAPGSTSQPAAPSAQATETSLPMQTDGITEIALVWTNNRTSGIQQAIQMLGISGFGGDRVLLKPNFNSVDAFPGSTHADTLTALVQELQNMGARSIVVGDRSGMGHTRSVMEQKGVLDQASGMGFETIALDELDDQRWTIISDSDFHWERGFAVPQLLLDADRVVQTCNLKTHRYGGHFTMALKNSVGLIAKSVGGNGYDYMTELHSSPYQRLMIAEVNKAYKPDLIVMDGIEAFVSGGPANGEKVSSELILAGTDPVAMDAVGVSILRLFGTTPEVSGGRVFEQEQIARAVELGLGIDSPTKIRFKTLDEDSAAYAERISAVLNA